MLEYFHILQCENYRYGILLTIISIVNIFSITSLNVDKTMNQENMLWSSMFAKYLCVNVASMVKSNSAQGYYADIVISYLLYHLDILHFVTSFCLVSISHL